MRSTLLLLIKIIIFKNVRKSYRSILEALQHRQTLLICALKLPGAVLQLFQNSDVLTSVSGRPERQVKHNFSSLPNNALDSYDISVQSPGGNLLPFSRI